MKLAQRLATIHPSPTLALNAKAKALAALGLDVVGLSAGEPDFDTPDHVKAAAAEAIRKGQTKYTATAGIPELRKAICEKLQRDNQLQYAPDQILVSAGAKHSIYNLFQALLSPDDEVIIFAPYWVSYPDMVILAGGKPVILDTQEEDGFAPHPTQLREALTPRTKAVVINSPSNPTGAVLDRRALEQMAEVLRGHDCLIVTDDIYEKLLYTPEPFVNILNVAPDLYARTVVVNGASKAYSMTGWRMGFAAGPKELITGMQMIQDQSTSNCSSITQAAALAAFTQPEDFLKGWVSEYRARRDLFTEGLNAIPGVRCRAPQGAFYMFPNVAGLLGKSFKGQRIATSQQLSEALLEHFRVAAVPGSAFGAEGFLRMSFCASRETIQKGLQRLRDLAGALG